MKIVRHINCNQVPEYLSHANRISGFANSICDVAIGVWNVANGVCGVATCLCGVAKSTCGVAKNDCLRWSPRMCCDDRMPFVKKVLCGKVLRNDITKLMLVHIDSLHFCFCLSLSPRFCLFFCSYFAL